MKREFYYQDEKSNKFWTIELQNNDYVTTYGRIGRSPRETRKNFSSVEEARVKLEKMITSKLKNGYVEKDNYETYICRN